MKDATRRGFLVFAGAGAAAAVGAVAAPKLFDNQAVDAADAAQPVDTAKPLQPAEPADAESFVVHVKDVKSGRLAIMVGEREVLVTDHELAARLAGVTNS